MNIAPIPNIINSFYDFSKADYIKIEAFLLSWNWKKTINNLHSNDATAAFYDALNSLTVDFVPKIIYKQSNFPIRFTKHL